MTLYPVRTHYLAHDGRNLYHIARSEAAYAASCVTSAHVGRGGTLHSAARRAARRYRSTAPEPRLPDWARPLERYEAHRVSMIGA